jgi:hypothetical protein
VKDWLGNDLALDDLVVYTSKSRNIGMVLGSLIMISDNMLKIKPIAYSAGRVSTKVIVLHDYAGAFNSVTKYQGAVNLD